MNLTDSPSPPPWSNRGTWGFSIVNLPARRHPFTHNAFAEIVDAAGNYRGRELGPFLSRGAAESAVKNFKP